MTNPVDEIRAAATKLRALAEAASTTDKGEATARWTTVRRVSTGPDGRTFDHSRLYGDLIINGNGDERPWPNLLYGRPGVNGGSPFMETRHAAYAATMGPALGLLLADWLDKVAAGWDSLISAADRVLDDTDPEQAAAAAQLRGGPYDAEHALAVARRINQETTR